VPIRVAGGQKFITVPYTFELNTGVLLSRHFDAEYYLETARAQFDVLLADARTAPRVMCLSMHPFAIGQPHAIGYLSELLGYLREADGVWWATADDIAQRYLDHVYDTEVRYEQTLTAKRSPRR
jgi:allantoinase